MSLFSSIQLASNSLRAAQIGLQVIGQNIANVNTPGYIREEVFLSPGPTQKIGDLALGLGVDVKGVTQQVDLFLEERLRNAGSDLASGETQETIYRQLEGLIGELSDTDLSTSLNNFFSGINEILNQPESLSIRNLAVLQGRTLSGDIVRMAKRVRDVREGLNDRIVAIAAEINRLTEDIRRLNIRIAQIEGGGTSNSQAVGLRDQRQLALTDLSNLIDIQVKEQLNSTVSVIVGGDLLVFEGTRRKLEAKIDSDQGLPTTEIRLIETKAPLMVKAGELAGLIVSRDDVLMGFLNQLDQFAKTLIFEFNKIYASGQGLNGYLFLTAEFPVDASDQPLDAVGLPFTPVNGSFQVQVFNKKTELTQTTNIRMNLIGLGEDSTMADLVASLSAIDGISAQLNAANKLEITSDSIDQEFSFGEDTSGLLTALGLNTFFSGSSAMDMGVNQVVIDDPGKFAASQSGIAADTKNAVEMASFLDRKLESENGASLSVLYDRLIAEATQGSTVAHSVAEGFRVFHETLFGQHLAISGVSLDEEAVKMISFQMAFRASARYIGVLSELLGVLINL